MEDLLDREESDSEVFEVLSVRKFIILCIFSLSLYQLWWIYKLWRFFKYKNDFKIMPAARAIFSIFFLVSLFSRIQDFSKAHGNTNSFPAVGSYIGFFATNLLNLLPDPYWLGSLFSMVFLVPALESFNYGIRNSGDYIVAENAKYSYRQIGIILIGGALLLLGILGLYLA